MREVLVFLTICAAETFREKLTVQPLEEEKVFTEVEFFFQRDDALPKHYRTYPRAIHEVTSKLKIEELHLSLAKGDSSDYQAANSKLASPVGAFLVASFQEDEIPVEDRWKSLVGVLAGLFCISLNQLDTRSAVTPPILLPSFAQVSSPSLRRVGFLPREVACTENLTPWKKIIPTGSTHGLAYLLDNPHYVQQNSVFWSLGFDFKSGDELIFWQRAIIDVRTRSSLQLLSAQEHSQPKTVLTAELLFGIRNSTTSSIAEKTEFSLVQSSQYSVLSEEILTKFEDDIRFNIPILWNSSKTENLHLKISRKSGGGQGEGSIKTTIFNPREIEEEVLTLEVVPWWLKPSLSSRRVRGCEETAYSYKAAHDAERVTGLIVFGFKIKPKSACIVEYDFKTAWPKWNEYPADANHGRYLPSVILFFQDALTSSPRRIFSESVLIYVPIPDFSMPYNVLCLACTVVAMAIGSVHNLTTSTVVPASSEAPQTNLGKIIHFVKGLLKKILRKSSKDVTKSEKIEEVAESEEIQSSNAADKKTQ
ncbi:Oidioi.mRNA.OKI2018_I69.XSR.g16183.t1.cds [Oikopleura dioica]|uniref:Oidioi.mRNA.OKI2018_I69.XSR.g16183.t1.cds n=1 Tax=Oikopleura dioica TaxID=34765 RepID=A0ABN7SFA2_OIKDI|nr:Oidioi.mRNA.OKI2018_I69.XSR.g16183.t1.cds [Oikopleura dioica]